MPASRSTLARLLLVLVAGVAAPAVAAAAERVPLAQIEPLPAAPEVSPEARALRERLLGPRAADPAYVTLHWVGVSSFVVTVEGHLFLFDAWEIVGAQMDYLPLGREELAGLEPEAILIGHGHFDHTADAGYVAGRTGATVLASEEQCQTIEEDAARDGNADRFTCAITGTQDTPAFGTLTPVRLFEDLAPITVLKNVHSATRPPGGGNEPDPFLPVFDPAPYLENPNTSPEELARFLETLEDPEGGTRMYHLRAGDFTLLLGDSAGPIFENPEVGASLDALPGCVDVMANAILGFDQPVSGLQDPVLYVASAHPRLFVPTHADAWAPALSAGQVAYRDKLAAEVGALPNPPEIDHLLDPGDYLAERAYRVEDPRWREPMPGSSCARAAGAGPADDGDGRDGAGHERRDRRRSEALDGGGGRRGGDGTSGSDRSGGGDQTVTADGDGDGGALPFTGLALALLALAGAALCSLGFVLRRRAH